MQADNNGNVSVFAGPVDITTPPPPAPTAPAQLAVTAATGSQLNLTWQDVATNESEYRVERAACGGTFQMLATLPANTTFFADTGANAGLCYTYRVTACNGGGCNSATSTFQPTLPPSPGQLMVVAAAANRLNLSWLDLATSELEYRVERAACGGTFQLLTTLPANSTSFADTEANAGLCYTYRVSACNGAGCTAATATFQPTPPVAPGQLTVIAASESQINLSWQDLANSELEYRVERAACGGTFQLLTTLPANSTSFADTGANAGLCYTYRVSACNSAGCTAATAAFQPTPPVAPGQLTVIAASGSQLNLTWQDLANSELEYRVERATIGGTFQFLTTLPANSTSFADTGVDAGVSYTYRVAACNYAGCTSATTAYGPTAPADPLGVNLVAIGRFLQVSWTDNAWNETGYKVQFRSASGIQILTYTRPPNSTSLAIGPVASGSIYTCQVWAFNEGGDSGHSPIQTVEVEKPAPSGVQASVNGSSISVTWSDNCPDEYAFEVLRYRDGALSSIFTVDANVTSFTDTGLPAGHYRYEVRATYFAGSSAPAISAEVTLLPAKPTLVSPANNQTGVHRPTTLDWDDVPGATSYRVIVEYQPSGTTTRIRKEDDTVTASTFTCLNLEPGRNYYWKVRAIRGSDLGPWSDEWHFATRPN